MSPVKNDDGSWCGRKTGRMRLLEFDFDAPYLANASKSVGEPVTVRVIREHKRERFGTCSSSPLCTIYHLPRVYEIYCT